MSSFGAALRSAAAALGSVLSCPGLRRIQLAWTIGVAADWAFLVILLVVVYDAGGAVAVAVLGLARMIPATLAGPLATLPLERFRGDHVLFGVHLVRLGGALALAAALGAGAPIEVIYVIGAVTAAVWALVRPIQNSLLPAIARSPGELVASNVASSMGEGLGTFVGPIAVGLVLAVAGPEAAAVLVAVLFGVAAAVVVRVPFEGKADAHGGETGGPRSIPFVAGLRALSRRPGPALIQVGFFSQVLVRGMLMTLTVVVAIELLGIGESGVGLLNAAIGLGGLVGALAALMLTGRGGLASIFAVSLALWGLPIAVIGLVPVTAVALAALFVVGLSNALLDISGYTMTQRGVANVERAAVFGFHEGLVGIGVALGGVLAAVLLDRLGIEGTLAVAGAILPIVAVATWPGIRPLDSRLVVPEERIRLLRALPLFAVLPLTALERIAEACVPVAFAPGEALMRKGEAGDRFILIETGTVEIRDGEVLLARLGPGDGVGEIALIRDVPRTATAVAATAVTGLAMDREPFQAALAGPAGSAAAAAYIDARLANPLAVE